MAPRTACRRRSLCRPRGRRRAAPGRARQWARHPRPNLCLVPGSTDSRGIRTRGVPRAAGDRGPCGAPHGWDSPRLRGVEFGRRCTGGRDRARCRHGPGRSRRQRPRDHPRLRLLPIPSATATGGRPAAVFVLAMPGRRGGMLPGRIPAARRRRPAAMPSSSSVTTTSHRSTSTSASAARPGTTTHASAVSRAKPSKSAASPP